MSHPQTLLFSTFIGGERIQQWAGKERTGHHCIYQRKRISSEEFQRTWQNKTDSAGQTLLYWRYSWMFINMFYWGIMHGLSSWSKLDSWMRVHLCCFCRIKNKWRVTEIGNGSRGIQCSLCTWGKKKHTGNALHHTQVYLLHCFFYIFHFKGNSDGYCWC